jgi:hypothetical protein
MATKQELELRVSDLENDIRELSRILTEIWVSAKSVNFDVSPKLEETPAYLLGNIQASARMAFLRCATVRGEDWIEMLDRAKEARVLA